MLTKIILFKSLAYKNKSVSPNFCIGEQLTQKVD